MTDFRSHATVALAFLVLSLPLAASGPELEMVPTPREGAVEPVAAEQIRLAQAALGEQVQEGGDPAVLAAAFMEMGQIFGAYELWDSAAAALRNAVKLQPAMGAYHYLLGQLELRAGRAEAAAAAFETASRLEPGAALIWLRLAETLLGLDQDAAARAAFEKALPFPKAAAAVHFGLGRLEARAGNDAAAVEHFRAALAAEPTAGRIYQPLSQALHRLGKTEEAAAALAQRNDQDLRIPDPFLDGMAAKANGAAFHKARGDQFVLDERFPEAVDAYRLAVATEPKNFYYRKSLALTLYHRGGVGEAIQQLEAALRVAPQTPDAEKAQVVFTLGGMLANQGELERAAERFAEALKLDPTLALAAVELGNLRARASDLMAALGFYDQAITIDGQLVLAHFRRATTLMDLGRFAEAVPALERVLELEAQYPQAAELLKVARERLAAP